MTPLSSWVYGGVVGWLTSQVSVERLVILWKLPFMAFLHIASANMLARLMNYLFSIKGMEANAVRAVSYITTLPHLLHGFDATASTTLSVSNQVTLSLMFGNVSACCGHKGRMG